MSVIVRSEKPKLPHAKNRPPMVWVPGGKFRMGSDLHYTEEAPARDVSVDGFWIAETPVTNRQFAVFIEETGWTTTAELPPEPEDYPGLLPEMTQPISLVFSMQPRIKRVSGPQDWWAAIPGADWRHPRGRQSDTAGLEDHPVVHLALADVEAYSQWAHADLPTEAEWECAAWGGLRNKEFAWGEDFAPKGRHMANTWQGDFPYENTAEDGFVFTSPVRNYPANGFGLFDMIGNVWEWTKTWWTLSSSPAGCCAAKAADSVDPAEARFAIPRKVIKGGSHLCAPNYCRRYRPAARHAHPIDTATSHLGFRCVIRPTDLKS